MRNLIRLIAVLSPTMASAIAHFRLQGSSLETKAWVIFGGVLVGLTLIFLERRAA